jgi:hypothetical protein
MECRRRGGESACHSGADRRRTRLVGDIRGRDPRRRMFLGRPERLSACRWRDHQNYLALHPSQPYIAINDLPKVAALKRLFPSLYPDTPVLVAAME